MRDKISKVLKESGFEKDIFYLLKKIDGNSGFFYFNNRVVYLYKSNAVNISSQLDTELLSLRCNIMINRVENSKSFEAGKYDIIFYNNSTLDDDFDIFTRLCEMYSCNPNKLLIYDFFMQLMELFKPKQIERTLNLIGFFGEIFFIYEIASKGILLSEYWHLNGSNAKYDFSVNKKINIEIKSTLKDKKIFKIKHDQLFDGNENYVVVYNFEENPSGNSVFELIDMLNSYENILNDINFQIKIETEKKKCHYRELNEKRFSIVDVSVYKVCDLESLNNVPDNISNITYDYDFNEENSIDIKDFVILLKNLILYSGESNEKI